MGGWGDRERTSEKSKNAGGRGYARKREQRSEGGTFEKAGVE